MNDQRRAVAIAQRRPAGGAVERGAGHHHSGNQAAVSADAEVAEIAGVPAGRVLVAMLAAVVALDGGNPFYKQKRVGRNGRVFTIWKLRTMVRIGNRRYVLQNRAYGLTTLTSEHVEITGYVAFPMLMDEADELLVMLNQWDGCCIGVPPTPYDRAIAT